MIVNCFIIHQLAAELNKKLSGGKLIDCFSTGKDDLILNFKSSNTLFNIKVTFIQNKPWFRFEDTLQQRNKNSILQFKSIHEIEIIEINAVLFDRIFYIKFSNNQILIFKCHGNSSNIFLFQENEPLFFQNFRKLKENEEITLEKLIEQKSNFDPSICKFNNEKELKSFFPFLGDPEISFLNESSFFTQDLENQNKQLVALKKSINNFEYTIVNKQLSLLNKEHNLKTSPIQFLTTESDAYIRSWHLEQRKAATLNATNKELSKKKQYLKQCLQKENENSKRVSYQEMADLLMSHLTEISKESKTFECTSFDGLKKVTISLDSKLSAIENVEKLYKKSKNEHKEISLLQDKINFTQIEITNLEKSLTELETDNWTTRVKKENKKLIAVEVLPYTIFTIDGFEFRVGKNAKSNDQLIGKHAQKHHIWFHARSVSGSHSIAVINKEQKIPAPTLEKMASVAAYYSKAKSQSLVPVIYTERKYVRKPKGALPGEVIVEKEKVILAKPGLPNM